MPTDSNTAASEVEPNAIDREIQAAIDQLEYEALGLAFPLHGLVYFPPLCHDGRDY